jgi:hypothetical protein
MGYEDIEEHRVKHLEMIQAVIGRLGNDSFLVKGWTITVAGVFLGFAVNLSSKDLAAASFLPILLFWSLDAYYLWAERLFRNLYDCVRRDVAGIEPFYMAATSDTFRKRLVATCPNIEVASRWEVLASQTLRRFYGAVCAAAAIVFIAL